MTTGTRRNGNFCWINILTPAPAEARAFFGSLLGWTYTALPGVGHIIGAGGHDVGGLWDLHSPNTPPGTPPQIGVMIRTDNADATAKQVTALGGTAKPPMDVMESGRMVVCTDPNGAAFDVWQGKGSQGTDSDTAAHGTPSWFESLTTDVGRAVDFYSRLFGWTAEAMPMPGMTYTTFKLGEEYVAGMMALTPEMGSMPPHWATYVTVNDVDETARQAQDLGATIMMPVKEVTGVGRFCGITSPQGITFFAITYTRAA